MRYISDLRGTKQSAFNIKPLSTVGPPTSGTHKIGDVAIDSVGDLFTCITAGTPGSWKQLDSSYHYHKYNVDLSAQTGGTSYTIPGITSYVTGTLSVYRNGVKLPAEDYTETTLGFTTDYTIPSGETVTADLLYYETGTPEVVSLSNITKTVKTTGGDFTTIQDAINWFKGKLLINCKISVDPGLWSEQITVEDIFADRPSDFTIEGDTRNFVGIHFVHGTQANPLNLSNMGTANGACTLSSSGSSITVAVAGDNPNFATAGFGVTSADPNATDYVIVRNTAGAISYHTVTSVSSNTINLSSAAPTVNGNGAFVILPPRYTIRLSSANPVATLNSTCTLKGFTLDQDGSGNGILSSDSQGQMKIQACVIDIASTGNGIFASRTSLINTDTYLSIFYNASGTGSGNGAIFWNCVRTTLRYIMFGKFAAGATVDRGTPYIDMISCVSVGCTTGFQAVVASSANFQSVQVMSATNGIYASNMSYIRALSTNALMIATTTKYSPATSDTVGNVGSYITWS